MKARDLFWGVFFILLGALLLLNKFDVIELWWRFRDIWRLWPVILILIGMNLIAKRTEMVYNVGIVLLLLAFGFLVVYGYQLQHRY